MNELIIGMIIMAVLTLLTVGVVLYAINTVINAKANKKAFELVDKLMRLYEPMFDKLKDYMDDM